jgi:hypothetical protein
MPEGRGFHGEQSMTRKIIQLYTDPGNMTVGLCDDGSTWCWTGVKWLQWAEAVPDDDAAAPPVPPEKHTNLWTLDPKTETAVRITSDEQLLACPPLTVIRESWESAAERNLKRWKAGDRDTLDIETIEVAGRTVEIIYDIIPF